MAIEGIEEYAARGNGRHTTGSTGGMEQFLLLKLEFEKLRHAIAALENDRVEVGNLDEVRAGLRDELNRLVSQLDLKWQRSWSEIAEAIKHFKYQVHFPESIVLPGIEALREDFDGLREVLEAKEFSPKIDVQVPEVMVPEIVIPPITIPPIHVPEARVEVDLSPLLAALKPLTMLSDKATKPISVRISDGARFIQYLKEVVKKQERVIQAFATSAGMTIDEYKTVSGIPAAITSFIKNVTTAGTAVQVTTTTTACKKVVMNARLGNTNPVVVGDASVIAASATQRGIVLIPGNDPVIVGISDLSKLYVDSQTNGDGVCGAYFT